MPQKGRSGGYSKQAKTLEERRQELQKVNPDDVADLYRYHHAIADETTPAPMKSMRLAAMIEAILTREFPQG